MKIILAMIFICGTLFLLKRFPTRELFDFAACLYVGAIFYLAFLGREPVPEMSYSFELFGAARRSIEQNGEVIRTIFNGGIKSINWTNFEGIALNVLLFIPFGYLLPGLWVKMNRWWKVVFLGAVSSLCIECIQFVTRLGYADIDDLIHNTLGALIGYGFYKMILYMEPRNKSD